MLLVLMFCGWSASLGRASWLLDSVRTAR